MGGPRFGCRRLVPVLLPWALAVVGLAGCARREPADLVVRDVTVVDVAAGEAIAGQAVVVRDGVVREVVPTGRASGYDAAVVVDGGGRTLMPALGDAHVHLRYPSELDLYLLSGVGLVVNMSGDPLHLELRRAVAEGGRAGPRIVTVGPTLDGSPPTNPLFTSVTPETAGELVGWMADRGYDAVKVYQQIDAESLAAVVRAAAVRGMITTGHVSRVTGIVGALDAGLRYVGHGEELAFEAFDDSNRRFDRGHLPELVAQVAARGVTVTPMIDYLEEVPRQVLALDGYLEEPPMARVPAAMKLSFGPRQGWFSGRDEPAAFAAQMADAAGFVAELTTALAGRGVPLVLGTDAGFGGAVPGHSVHRELRSLVRAGLSPVEALRAATLNVGRYLRQIDPDGASWGRIEPGLSADLLLVDGNPLEEISATERIEGVALAGRWHGRDELRQIGRRLRRRQVALLPHARALEEAIVGGDVAAARAAAESRPAELADEALIAPDNCIFLGYRHYYGGRRELAGELYEICAEMHPGSAPLWWHIGRAREEAGDGEGAIRAYERALDANPWYRRPAEAIRALRSRSAG